MRFLMKVLLVLMVLLVTPAVFAQSDDGSLVFNVAGISDGCGDTMNADDCMASGSTTYTLCTQDACPQCAFDQTETQSICYKLTGALGYCSCTGRPTVARDKYGSKYPSCSTSGSCVNHRQ